MKLGKFVDTYLAKNKMSQRQFAKKCGLSSGYISMIVNGVNPRSNTPIVPSLKSLSLIAHGMNMTIDELFLAVDDMLVEINMDMKKGNNIEKKVLQEEYFELFTSLSVEKQKQVLDYIRYLATSNNQ